MTISPHDNADFSGSAPQPVKMAVDPHHGGLYCACKLRTVRMENLAQPRVTR